MHQNTATFLARHRHLSAQQQYTQLAVEQARAQAAGEPQEYVSELAAERADLEARLRTSGDLPR